MIRCASTSRSHPKLGGCRDPAQVSRGADGKPGSLWCIATSDAASMSRLTMIRLPVTEPKSPKDRDVPRIG
jgi:hypothetical protein